MAPPTSARIGVIGAGAAGLITAHTLLQDGFQNVEVLTRDETPGGVWAASRIYPGLSINNVHGEFRFSPLPMPPPANFTVTGGRLSGDDMRMYMETFAAKFLPGKIRYRTEILSIRPSQDGAYSWTVTARRLSSGNIESIAYDKIVLCTGGCSAPKIPEQLTSEKAKLAGFTGPTLHSSQFRQKLDAVLKAGKNSGVVVVGGGKSAQDVAAYLAKYSIRVSMVFTTTDAVLATPIPYPAMIRKSRLLSVLSPHVELRTGLERFLHTTWLGAHIVHAMWAFLTCVSFWVLSVPPNSPLRNAPGLFWTVSTNDEGTSRKDDFHTLVKDGKIELVAPARAAGYGADGQSVLLEDGRTLPASAIILATGFTSSWNGIFDGMRPASLTTDSRLLPASDATISVLRLGRSTASLASHEGHWKYATLARSPSSTSSHDQRGPSLYRGIVPAKNITRRNLAVNGAIFTTNNGYIDEVTAHWISSYFLEDSFLSLPSSPEDAMAWTDRNAAWLRTRYPDSLSYANESYSGDVAFWRYAQSSSTNDEERGNVFTWPFKVIDLDEIKHLREERAALRTGSSSSSSSKVSSANKDQ
ncbi:FAD/NAD-P-binding domain-containing protein [Fomitopsis serialis]|uniref:FAD/NAD-P-binding domain-containing protein n=1 Tax=Fomitopsis serialis TaxID=139415 RepID=UPI002008C205|nr:FAD/NAD-P-binding domain-containing protein [Neoantrodia serialis]KAH9922210.1 FAD/NAD-P-binding domain-containing protein [Neoantrodia serialis]